MGRATTYLYEHEDDVARRKEDEARVGRTAHAIAADGRRQGGRHRAAGH
jgi:hypothetical protein